MTEKPGTEASTPSTSLRAGLTRTRLAFERTLMAWIRTAVSLITFGFTLDKTARYLREHDGGRTGILRSMQWFAIATMVLGIAALTLAAIQHRRHIQMLRALDTEFPLRSVASVVAALLVVLGVVAFVEMIASR